MSPSFYEARGMYLTDGVGSKVGLGEGLPSQVFPKHRQSRYGLAIRQILPDCQRRSASSRRICRLSESNKRRRRCGGPNRCPSQGRRVASPKCPLTKNRLLVKSMWRARVVACNHLSGLYLGRPVQPRLERVARLAARTTVARLRTIVWLLTAWRGPPGSRQEQTGTRTEALFREFGFSATDEAHTTWFGGKHERRR